MFLAQRRDETIFRFREAIYPGDENRRQWTHRNYPVFNRWIQPAKVGSAKTKWRVS